MVLLFMISEAFTQLYFRVITWLIKNYDELFLYAGIICGALLINDLLKLSFLYYKGIRVKTKLHEEMMSSLTYASIKFYDNNPTG